MKRFLAIILFFFVFVKIEAQQETALDSLRHAFVLDSTYLYRPKKFRWILSYDSRLSFISKAPVNFVGGQAGLSYRDTHTFGIGGYRITQSSRRANRRRDLNSRVVDENLTLNYGTVYYQYMLFDKKYLEIDVPLEGGFGKAHIVEKDAVSGDYLASRDFNIFPCGLGLQAIVKPIKWAGVSFLIGYRFVTENQRSLNFNGMYFSLGLWLDFRQVLRDTRFYGIKKPRYHKAIHKITG